MDVDAVADGKDVLVAGIMQHIEDAGVHSGDSACVIPPVSIAPKHIETISEYTRKIAIELNVIGLMNIQYAISNDIVYVLEANPRASRTVPIVSKVCNIPMAKIAAKIMLGAKLADMGLARAASDKEMAATEKGKAYGTPYYISPEQIEEGPISPQSDVYSLGAVLYEMLTGNPPFAVSVSSSGGDTETVTVEYTVASSVTAGAVLSCSRRSISKRFSLRVVVRGSGSATMS